MKEGTNLLAHLAEIGLAELYLAAVERALRKHARSSLYPSSDAIRATAERWLLVNKMSAGDIAITREGAHAELQSHREHTKILTNWLNRIRDQISESYDDLARCTRRNATIKEKRDKAAALMDAETRRCQRKMEAEEGKYLKLRKKMEEGLPEYAERIRLKFDKQLERARGRFKSLYKNLKAKYGKMRARYETVLDKMPDAMRRASNGKFSLDASGAFKKLNGAVLVLPNIPCDAGVYAQMLGGEILRIGQTTANLGRAFAQKFAYDSVAFMPCAREDVILLEKALIKAEKPPINKEHFVDEPLLPTEISILTKYSVDNVQWQP